MLPFEILGHIFEAACLPAFILGTSHSQHAMRGAALQPFALAAVCRQWRAVSLASPRTWALLSFNLDWVDPDDEESLWVAMIFCVLARSGCASLAVTFSRGEHLDNQQQLVILQRVAPHLERCTRLDIILDDLREDDPTFMLLRAHMPELVQAAVIVIDDSNYIFNMFGDDKFLRPAKGLAFLRISWIFFDHIGPLPGLEDCVLHRPTCIGEMNNFADLHDRAPQLRTLCVLQPDYRSAEREVQWSNLQTLEVELAERVVDIDGLSRQFVAPKLSKLVCRGHITTSTGRVAFVENISSYAALLHLTISNLANHDFAQFANMLRSARRLQTLHLESTHFHQFAMFSLLLELRCRFPDDTWAAPNLENLLFTDCSFVNERNPQDLLNYAEARLDAAQTGNNGAPRALRRIEVKEWSNLLQAKSFESRLAPLLNAASAIGS